MHLKKRFVNRVLPFEDTEKRQIGRRRAAKFVIDQIEILAQQLAGFLRQRAMILLCIVKNTDQVLGMFFDDVRVGYSDMIFRQANPLAKRSPEHVGRTEAEFIVVGNPMDDQRRQPIDMRRVEIVTAHEYFDPAQSSLTFKSQCRADFFLMLERQLILVLAGGKMQFIAHPKQKILGLFQLRDVARLDDVRTRQPVEIFYFQVGARDPTGRLNVAQAAFALLDVGLEQINRAAELFMPSPVFCELLADKSSDTFFYQPLLDFLFEVLRKRVITA